MPQRKLEELTEDECFTLLGQEVVGRLVYVDDQGPVAIPVNYALDGRSVVFRTEGGSKVDALRHPLAFEVDHVDPVERSGWSVLVRGTGRLVELATVPEMLHRMAGRFPAPWAVGHHNTWVAISPDAVTGRNLAAPFFAPIV